MTVKRFMCVRVLHEDGEHMTPTHVRVVAEIDYDALAAELAECKESHDKYCPSTARIRELEAQLRILIDEIAVRGIPIRLSDVSAVLVGEATASETKGEQG